jgi:hypothetical protein
MTGGLPSWLRVKSGDTIRARLVDELVRQIEDRTVTAGVNCRVHAIPGVGVSVEALAPPQNFPHPWDTGISGNQAAISVGLVNGSVPYVNGVSMDGLDASGNALPGGAPKLQLDESLYDVTGRSWICVQVTVDPASGQILPLAKGGLSIVQAKQIYVGEGGALDQDNTGLWPLCMLRRPSSATSGYGTLYDVAYFNLNHRYVVAANQGGPARHFFWV